MTFSHNYPLSPVQFPDQILQISLSDYKLDWVAVVVVVVAVVAVVSVSL